MCLAVICYYGFFYLSIYLYIYVAFNIIITYYKIQYTVYSILLYIYIVIQYIYGSLTTPF